MNFKDLKHIYFIGIGGIGMSALAKYFAVSGFKVAGYDRTPSAITKSLEEIGVAIHFTDNVKEIPKNFLNKADTLVVYTPAIPKNHKEYNYFINNKFSVFKRAQLLGLITKNTFSFAVAGTHGKTTTSSILGHILHESGLNATSFLGGIAENYNSNLIQGGNKISVVEADEFDRSFLQLSPDIACITSMDADHLDIYGEAAALVQSFNDFAAKVKDKLFVRYRLPMDGITYGFEDDADYRAFNLKVENGAYVFDVATPVETYKNIRLNLAGKHNVLNTLVALAMANSYGVPLPTIAKALLTFKGVKRRFTYKIKTDDFVLIDDYAHHPTEIDAVANAVKEMYPDRENLVVFQPHLFSRTKDFADDFADSLSKFDQVILLEIYPAREEPVKGVNSKWLLSKIANENKQLISKKDVMPAIIQSKKRVVLMLGAGDIGVLIEEVAKSLKEKIDV
ncbi:MAG: UDP-N-acetylmuramate--L-alanine ligase [Flavobacteriales bacterium]|nr:MAG: UDP-N-acetylmuramate--L-alanine ligase [Flavobacteriales bacterium]